LCTIVYIFIHHQDGSTVDIRRLNKMYNLTKKQRMKQSSPNAHAMRFKSSQVKQLLDEFKKILKTRKTLKNSTKHTECYHLNLNRHRLIKQFLYSENSTLGSW